MKFAKVLQLSGKCDKQTAATNVTVTHNTILTKVTYVDFTVSTLYKFLIAFSMFNNNFGGVNVSCHVLKSASILFIIEISNAFYVSHLHSLVL